MKKRLLPLNKVEMKADHLEAELARASKSHQGTCATKKKPSKSKCEPPITMEVQGSSKKINEAHLQEYNFGFKVCKLIMWGCFPKIRGVTELLVPYNAMLEEIINTVSHRRGRLMRALRLFDFVFPPSFSKK